MLALGSMAVAARVVLVLGFTTILAGVHVTAKLKSAASLNRAHHLSVTGQHLAAILGTIL